jgi:hypothetical protein
VISTSPFPAAGTAATLLGVGRYHVTINFDEPAQLNEATSRAGVEVFRQTSRDLPEGPGRRAVSAMASEEQIETLLEAGLDVQRHEDIEEGRAERLAEVGQGDRYAQALRELNGR